MRWITILALLAALNVVASAQGPQGPALQFDGVDDWVDFGAGPAAGAPFTIEAWVKPTLASTQTQLIAGPYGSKTGCFAGAGFRLAPGTDTTPGALSFVVGLAGCGNDDVIDGPVPTLGQWYHLAGTYDGSTMRFYVDGALIGELTNIDYTPFARLVAGASFVTSANAPQFFYGGEIDDLRMWDHVRSQSEIDAGRSQNLQGDETGLTGYWNFDEGSGQTVAESVAGVYSGRLGNTDAEDDADPTWTAIEVEEPPTAVEALDALLDRVRDLDVHPRCKAGLAVRLRVALALLRDDRDSNDIAVVPILRSFVRSLSGRCDWWLLDPTAQDLAASANDIIDQLQAAHDPASRSGHGWGRRHGRCR